jgi:hypothetical protein
MQLEHWQYFHLLDRFGVLVPSLLSSEMLRALTNHSDIQQELSYVHQVGMSQVAKQVILFSAVYAAWPQSLHALREKVAFITRLRQGLEVTLEEAIQHDQRSDEGVFSPFLQELGTLIAAVQTLSHKRREEDVKYPHLRQ